VGDVGRAGEQAFEDAADRLGLFGGAARHFRSPLSEDAARSARRAADRSTWQWAAPRDLEPTDPPVSAMLGLRHAAEIRRSMRVNGYTGRAVAVVEHDGRRFVVDGNHRLAAAEGVLDEIPYRVVTIPFLGFSKIDDVTDGWKMCWDMVPEWMRRRGSPLSL
jgi:hypothetical protein